MSSSPGHPPTVSTVRPGIYHPPTGSQPSVAPPGIPRIQGRYWLGTFGGHWVPCLPPGVAYIKGQKEVGLTSSYVHWQVLVVTQRKVTLSRIKGMFLDPTFHFELSRSEAASAYVWKEDTRVPGSQFELGQRPVKRSNAEDWERVWDLAKTGELLSIPASIRIQHYRTLRSIGADFAIAQPMERRCFVFVGPTGTGKSRRAWDEATFSAYPKDPRTKFWCGYQGQANVVIDEFRGDIDVSHLLRWLDRYPVIVEIKGASVVLSASTIWITSNLYPESWYPTLDTLTLDALKRRLEIVDFE